MLSVGKIVVVNRFVAIFGKQNCMEKEKFSISVFGYFKAKKSYDGK